MANTNNSTDWYDYPQYFDMVFRDETPAEIAFFEKAFERFANRKVRRVLEPGCGSGRLIMAMAKLGYESCGLDLSKPMLGYLRQRLRRGKLSAETVHGDMTRMKFSKRFDAAFCTFNTFRHLQNDADAIAHLRSVSDSLAPGGIYILGFHQIPLDADEDCIERWNASAGGTKVSVTLRVINFDRKARQETLRVSIKAAQRSGNVHRIRSEFPLRLYTAAQTKRLFRKVDDIFELAGVFDFDYDIEQPRTFDDDLTDALFVLRKRGNPAK